MVSYIPHNCDYCNEEFSSYDSGAERKFCCPNCYVLWREESGNPIEPMTKEDIANFELPEFPPTTNDINS
jgi:hypothetical protein